MEQFDKSSASWNVPLQRDWRIVNFALNSPRYGMALASIPATKLTVNLIFPTSVSGKYLPIVKYQNLSHLIVLGLVDL